MKFKVGQHESVWWKFLSWVNCREKKVNRWWTGEHESLKVGSGPLLRGPPLATSDRTKGAEGSISKSSITVNQPLRNIIKPDETRILRPDSRASCVIHLGKSNFVGPSARLPTSRPGLYLVFCCNVIALKLLGSGMQTCSVLH